MLRTEGVIYLDKVSDQPEWRVTIGHTLAFPIPRGEKVRGLVISTSPQLNENAYGRRPLWLILKTDPQRYEIQLERDGSCKIGFTWPLLGVHGDAVGRSPVNK